MKKSKGFTLIELLIVIAIVAVLIGVTIVAINPFQQLGSANNAARWAGITTIMNAVYQNIIDNGGTFATSSATDIYCEGDIPTGSAVKMAYDAAGTDPAKYDICGCLTTTTFSYLGMMPTDPTDGTLATDATIPCVGYDTGYTIIKDATTGRITISAPSAQLGESIAITR